MQAALARHDALLREAIEGHGGYVFKTVGDAFCAAFPTAPQAVGAALEAQRALRQAQWDGAGPIKVRMALHTGAAEVRDGDYFGQPLNRVARLLSTGYGEQILLSLATQQLVREDLPPDTDLKDLGEGGLKDLVRSEHVYQLVAPGLPADFPPLKSLDTRYVEPDATGRRIENPYKGLRAFHQEDASDFFGREELTEQLLGRMAEQVHLSRFLAVVGPSGSGKSSVVRAGLVPALRQGKLAGSERWLIVEMLPGSHPLEELDAVLLSIAANPPATLMELLEGDERGLIRAAKRVLPQDETVELALIIDQFEEVFTLVEDEPARVHFLESLHAAITNPRSRIRVIITLRADFYDRPLLYPDPGDLIRRRTEVVLPLSAEELERAIVRPAQKVGVAVERELVAAIIKDVGEQPGSLPLLQYALTELFERRVGRTMTLGAYRESGGVLGALGKRAEETYLGLAEGEQEAARQLFLRLVTLGEGVEDTRRRVRRAELEAVSGNTLAIERVIIEFGRYRLLTFDRDSVTRGATVEVAHEALIRTWDRLREWLEASRERLRVQRQLLLAAADWTASGHDPSYLASGVRLSQFETLAVEKDPALAVALTGEERAYVQASVTRREGERSAREQQRRRVMLGLVGGMVLTLILAAFAVVQSVQANDQRNVAVVEANARATAEAQSEVRRKEAEEQQRLAFSRELAAKSRSNLSINPNLSLLLAIEAAKAAQTEEAEDALRSALIETQPHAVLRYPPGSAVTSAAFNSTGEWVATTSDSNITRVWEVSERTGNSGNVVAELSPPDETPGGSANDLEKGVVFRPDGKQVAVISSDRVRVWDVETHSVVMELTGHIRDVNSAAFSPDGERIVTAGSDKTARVWDVKTGQTLLSLTGHTDRVNDAAFSPDGERIVTAGADDTARLWDAGTGQPIRELRGHTDGVNSAAFSTDGERIVTAGNEGTTRVWDASTGRSLRELQGHAGAVTGAAFSPDGKLVVTGGVDNTTRVWDVDAGETVAQIVGAKIAPSSAAMAQLGPPRMSDVAFSPDDKRVLLVTAGGDVAARIYPWQLFTPLDRLISIALPLAPRQLSCEERQTYLREEGACGEPTGTPTP